MGFFRALSFAFGSSLVASFALATVTLEPRSPYLAREVSGVSTVFYALANGSGYTIDDGFSKISTTAGTAGTASLDDNSIVYFKASTDQEFTVGSGQRLVLSVFVKTASGEADYTAVPIAKYNGVSCPNNGFCQIPTSGNTLGTNVGVNLGTAGTAGQVESEIGIYLRDLCAHGTIFAGSSTEQLCTATKNVMNTPTSSEYRTALVKVAFGVVSDAVSPVSLSASDTDLSQEVYVRLKADAPTMSCPSTEELSLVYYPGDGEIQLETNYFRVTDPTSGALTDKLVVIGKAGGAPNASTLGSNDIVARVDPGSGTQRITGFRNIGAESDADNTYQLWFGMRDLSGAVSQPSSACGLSSVRTSAVSGFLQKGNCFIATATFRDPNARAVRMLRDFRDTALSRFASGRWLVRQYNRLSPPAAEWLMRNPEYRVFSFIALSPFIVFAYLVLNPLVALGVAAILFAMVFSYARATRQRGLHAS